MARLLQICVRQLPESIDLFDMMHQAVQMTITPPHHGSLSQAYLVKRVYGLTFDVGVFLNMAPTISAIEHLALKTTSTTSDLLMENSRSVIVNSDMDHFSVVKRTSGRSRLAISMVANPNNQIEIPKPLAFQLSKLAGDYDIQLIGPPTKENTVAAGRALRLGAGLETSKESLLTRTFLVV